MKFSAQEEYGLRCLLSIARRGPETSLTIPEISRMEGLTPSHVAKLLAILRRHGFVASTRGQQGGYTLGYPADEIRIGDVLDVLGGRLYGTGFCERHSGMEAECVHESDCMLRPLWASIQNAVDGVVSRMTLADVLHGQKPSELITLQSLEHAPAGRAR